MFCRNPYEVESSSMTIDHNTVTWTITSNAACDVHFEVNATCYPSWPGNKDCQTDVVVENAHLTPHIAWAVSAQLPTCYQVDGAFDNHDGFYRMIDTRVGGSLPCTTQETTTTTEPTTTTSTMPTTTTTTKETPSTTTTITPMSSPPTSIPFTPRIGTAVTLTQPQLPNTGAYVGAIGTAGLGLLLAGLVIWAKGKRLRKA